MTPPCGWLTGSRWSGAYREPQKWSALWLLALVTLSAGAVEAIAERAGRSRAWAAPALAYVLILCALLPAGLMQIRSVPSIVDPVEYPGYWYRTEAYLEDAVPDDDPVVVLPWHLYQPLVASEGRLVANPARVFFPGELVVPQNLEIPGRFTDVASRYDRIGAVIERRGHASVRRGSGNPRRRVEVGARPRRDGGEGGDCGATAMRLLAGAGPTGSDYGPPAVEGTKVDHSARATFWHLGTVGYTRAAPTGGKGEDDMGSKIVAALAALTITGSVAWAGMTGPPHHKPPKGPGYGYHGGKVTICHKIGSKRHKRYVTIRVSQRAVRAHLRHGDRLGKCRRR